MCGNLHDNYGPKEDTKLGGPELQTRGLGGRRGGGVYGHSMIASLSRRVFRVQNIYLSRSSDYLSANLQPSPSMIVITINVSNDVVVLSYLLHKTLHFAHLCHPSGTYPLSLLKVSSEPMVLKTYFSEQRKCFTSMWLSAYAMHAALYVGTFNKKLWRKMFQII